MNNQASSQKAFEPPECPNIQFWVYRIGNHSRGAKMNTAINTVTRLGNTEIDTEIDTALDVNA
jgi:hypothetical protein